MDYRDAAHHFGVLYRRSQAFIVSACLPWNIGFSEFVFLTKLYENEGATLDELAYLLITDKGLMARTIKNLEDKGYIRREQDIHDKRQKHIYSTQQALGIKDKLYAVLETWITNITAGLEPIVVEHTIQGLRKITENAATIAIKSNKGSEVK
ncbi:MAG: MarR family transcriptional regulator [Megasphaera sp.]|jgi:DNA-binding MarR family transcriptional regulator|uniref:MarR family winged helix-turn-helix transcriptional regulator n=1 Tax=Megasphaera sueciensis TaxID=349094 RepID=UPI003D02290F|nr:MarR family transcriptional regulator [Megasphaera sp.]MCI1823455.1 MarR family transcriptional regulator [Megasphaera sp.]